MGWGSGSRLMSDVISAMGEGEVAPTARVKVYGILIDAFENQDCDTLDECLGEDPAYDEAYFGLHPPEEDEPLEDDFMPCSGCGEEHPEGVLDDGCCPACVDKE